MADDGICDFGVHDLGRGQEAGGGVDGRLGVIELELGRLQGRSVAASVDLRVKQTLDSLHFRSWLPRSGAAWLAGGLWFGSCRTHKQLLQEVGWSRGALDSTARQTHHWHQLTWPESAAHHGQ